MNLTKENLIEHVDVDTETGCWNWKHARVSAGYGHLWINGKVKYAHRVAWRLFAGPIPDGLLVCHHCDNPSCCNPAHLFLGTKTDNALDAAAKGRLATGERHGLRTHPERVARGERQGRAKLSEQQVLDIRSRHAAGRITKAALARNYGVSSVNIWEIIHRKTWKHI